MPIRVNLLAEALAQEDMRRRDPVKRSFIVGSVLIAAAVIWSVSLWVKAIAYKKELADSERLLAVNSLEHKQVLNNLKQTQDITAKLTALDKLSSNRFLVGNLLNALQRATLDDVQLTRLRLDQNLILADEVKAGVAKRPTKPATVTERTLLTLDARDSCSKPGDLIPKFQKVITEASYFDTMLDTKDPQRVRLKEGSYGAQQMGPDGHLFQPFTLECHFPEKTR